MVIAAVANNPISRTFMWEWFKAQYKIIAKAMPLNLYDRVILSIVPIHGIGKGKDVTEFLQSLANEYKIVKGAVEIAIEQAGIYEKLTK